MTGTGCTGVHLIGGPDTHQRVRICVQYKGSARVVVQGCLRAGHGREHWRCGVLKVPGSTRNGGKGKARLGHCEVCLAYEATANWLAVSFHFATPHDAKEKSATSPAAGPFLENTQYLLQQQESE